MYPYSLLFMFGSKLEGCIEPTILVDTLLLGYIGFMPLASVLRPVDDITKSNTFSSGAL
jgi:hypothetical protein